MTPQCNDCGKCQDDCKCPTMGKLKDQVFNLTAEIEERKRDNARMEAELRRANDVANGSSYATTEHENSLLRNRVKDLESRRYALQVHSEFLDSELKIRDARVVELDGLLRAVARRMLEFIAKPNATGINNMLAVLDNEIKPYIPEDLKCNSNI